MKSKMAELFITAPHTGESKEISVVHDVEWNISEKITEIEKSFKTLHDTVKCTFMVSKRLSVALKQIFGICKPPRYHRTGIKPMRRQTRRKQRLTRLQRRLKRQRG